MTYRTAYLSVPLALLTLACPLAHAIDLVTTNSQGLQGTGDGGIPAPSAISNDGNTILWLSSDSSISPRVGEYNFIIKTMNSGAITDIVRRLDGVQLENPLGYLAYMDEPPTRIIFGSAEPNIIPNTIPRGRLFSTVIGSYQYQQIAPDGPNAVIFTANSSLDKIYFAESYGANGVSKIQLYGVSSAQPALLNLITAQPSGQPSQVDGRESPIGYEPGISASKDGRIVVWQGDQYDTDPEHLGTGSLYPPNVGRSVFVRDTVAGVTRKVLDFEGANLDGGAVYAHVSDDGSFLAFSNVGGYFMPGCGYRGIVGIELRTWTRECLSVTTDGVIGEGFNAQLDVSADGNRVVFATSSRELQNPLQGFVYALYVRDRRLGRTVRIDVSDAGAPGSLNSRSLWPKISKNGRWVAFASSAPNLIPNDANGTNYDVFRVDLNRFLPDPTVVVPPPIAVPLLSAWASFGLVLTVLLGGIWARR
jgi:hypothetical protein